MHILPSMNGTHTAVLRAAGRLRPATLQLSPAATALLAAWMLSMISVPIAIWTFGTVAIPSAIALTVALQSICVLAILKAQHTWSQVARVATTVVVGAWAIEWTGSQHGYLFGQYDYTNLLAVQVADVPVLIPVAWLMMLPPAWAVGQVLSGRTSGTRFVVLSALAFTAWDLFLDPQMVSWRVWIWREPSGYYGIPWHNFFGWFVAAALLTIAARPSAVPLRPLLLVYTLTWALQTVGLSLFWGMPGPALWGFLAMGTFVILSWREIGRTGSLRADSQ